MSIVAYLFERALLVSLELSLSLLSGMAYVLAITSASVSCSVWCAAMYSFVCTLSMIVALPKLLDFSIGRCRATARKSNQDIQYSDMFCGIKAVVNQDCYCHGEIGVNLLNLAFTPCPWLISCAFP